MKRARGGIEEALGASVTHEHISLLTVSINKLAKADLVYLWAGKAYPALGGQIHGYRPWQQWDKSDLFRNFRMQKCGEMIMERFLFLQGPWPRANPGASFDLAVAHEGLWV